MLQRAEGELRAGGQLTLHFAAGPARLPVEVAIEEYAPRERVRWVGGRLGIRGDHSYSFGVQAPGTTRFTSSETFSGLGARLIAGPLFAKLDGETHHSMERFKSLVEAAHT